MGIIQPAVGGTVHVFGEAFNTNGTDVAPAIITRVWGEHPDGGFTVNLTVFPDAALPKPATSMVLYQNEEQARERSQHAAAFWPARG